MDVKPFAGRKHAALVPLLLWCGFICSAHGKGIQTNSVGTVAKMFQRDDVTEEIRVDVTNWREVMEVTNQMTGMKSVAVLDFRKSLASAYIEAADACFLMGGLDSRLPLPEELLEAWEEQESGSEGPLGPGDADQYDELTYTPASDMPAADSSMLAEEVQLLCTDRNIVWLERKHTGKIRARRQVDVRASGQGSVGSRGTIADGDLHVDYTRRSGSTSHAFGGSVGGTYVRPRGFPSYTQPRWEARYGITRHGSRRNYGVDFNVGGGRGGASRAGVRFRIEF